MTCPSCGAARLPDAAFCEECAHDFTGGDSTGGPSEPAEHTVRAPATPETAPAGEESPLDTGWTGRPTPAPSAASPEPGTAAPTPAPTPAAAAPEGDATS